MIWSRLTDCGIKLSFTQYLSPATSLRKWFLGPAVCQIHCNSVDTPTSTTYMCISYWRSSIPKSRNKQLSCIILEMHLLLNQYNFWLQVILVFFHTEIAIVISPNPTYDWCFMVSLTAYFEVIQWYMLPCTSAQAFVQIIMVPRGCILITFKIFPNTYGRKPWNLFQIFVIPQDVFGVTMTF